MITDQPFSEYKKTVHNERTLLESKLTRTTNALTHLYQLELQGQDASKETLIKVGKLLEELKQ